VGHVVLRGSVWSVLHPLHERPDRESTADGGRDRHFLVDVATVTEDAVRTPLSTRGATSVALWFKDATVHA